MKSSKKRFLLNLMANIFVFITQVVINFFLVPYISCKIGDEAVGFTNLATNIISYAGIVTAALNGMAGRFITLSYHQRKYDDTNEYFTSIFIMNLIFSSILTIITTVVVLNLEYLINIPQDMVSDVKLTFALVFMNTALLLGDTVYSVSTFIKNRLELSAIKQITANLMKAILLLLLFKFLPAKMFYQGIATILASLIIVSIDIFYTKKLTPELKISFNKFNLKKVKEVMKEGVWNSVTRISEILLTGLDLLIANLFVGPAMMGLLAIAKTLPQAIISLTNYVAQTFYPKCAYLYSKKEKNELAKNFNMTIIFETIIVAVPMLGLIFFGKEFYSLWLPNKSEESILIIQILSVITLLYTLGNALVEGLYYANILTKKIKVSVLVTIGVGVVSTLLVLIFLKFTSWGVYAIAGISSVMMLVRSLVFTPVYCSYVLDLKWTYFYKQILKSIFVMIVIAITFYLISLNITIISWWDFFLKVLIIGIIGYIEVFILYINEFKRIKK